MEFWRFSANEKMRNVKRYCEQIRQELRDLYDWGKDILTCKDTNNQVFTILEKIGIGLDAFFESGLVFGVLDSDDEKED